MNSDTAANFRKAVDFYAGTPTANTCPITGSTESSGPVLQQASAQLARRTARGYFSNEAFTGHRWEKALVLQKIGPRSYEVQTESGGTYRRNRQHLRLQNETFPEFEAGAQEEEHLGQDKEENQERGPEEISETLQDPGEGEVGPRRSLRTKTRPSRFRDFEVDYH